MSEATTTTIVLATTNDNVGGQVDIRGYKGNHNREGKSKDFKLRLIFAAALLARIFPRFYNIRFSAHF